MSKQLIRTYTFTPGAAGVGTIKIPGKYDLNQLTLITNVTRNTIIYNFADPSYTSTSVSFNRANTTDFPQALQNTDGVTTITLGFPTTGHASTDSLQIFVERQETITRPWAMGTDAFERTRMAAPRSMLDADFEYGLQPTKWQTVSSVRGYPGIYEIPGTDLQTITTITTDYSGGNPTDVESLITVNCSGAHSLTTGTAITVKALDSSISGYARAEGSFVINAVPTTTSFNYYAKARVGSSVSQQIQTNGTQIRKGGFYTGAAIGSTTFSTSGSGAATTGTVTVTFANAHGLIAGDSVYVGITSDNGSNNHSLCQGPFYILSVPTSTTLTYNARSVGTITGTPAGSVYARSDSFYIHRPYDGGVSLGTGGPAYGAMAVRMSKKYIRYQSGKAINYNTGALFAPNYDVRSVTASGTTVGSTITVITDDIDHGLQAGAVIVLSGVNTSGYNGTYTVASVVDERTFTFLATSVLGATTTTLSTPCQVALQTWYGSTVRSGTFDDQNGMFWQFDGQQMALGLRTSTLQLAGTVAATPDSNLITGVNTRFNEQLKAGDRIVLKGMSHVVSGVTSATWMTVTPDYRGSTLSTAAKIVKTRDILIPQNQWNVDRCDGSGGVYNPSGYWLQPNKMQMIGLQWTWYGAGFIDWMLRGPEGNYITVHRIKNSNVNGEAYMRTGNMPVRYEVQNEGALSTLTNDLSSVGTVMTVTDLTYFPDSGIVLVDNEQISYTARSATSGTGTLTIGSRAAAITQWVAGSNRTFSGSTAAAHTAGVGVILIGQTATPVISHWGSAFITDGGFDEDRGYIFNYNATNVAAQIRKTTAFAIRLAPSVSNAITGDLGVRELINRAQLLLQGIEITAGSAAAGQALVVEGVLNPSNYPTNTNNITWQSLTNSGQPSFSQIAAGSSIVFDNTATIITTLTAQANSGTSLLSVASTASIAVGDAISGSIYLQGATTVSAIGAGTVTISSPIVNSNITNGASVTFSRNQYAAPGETIFSFISSPSSKDSLDLSPLKELTNTPIGGRGTFPNGPDVLMINVYVTQGAPISTNLVLRWGEAQA
jgi:hypothetical protein